MNDSEGRFDDVPDHGGVRGFEPEFVDVDGLRTRYYDLGDGDPLVLVHGGLWSGSSSANAWSLALDGLRREFRVLAFDRVGCGMTDNPEDAEDYRFGTELDHALGFLDALGIEECHLCGASRGGALGARMAVETPERFRTFVVTNSHSLGPPAGDRARRGDHLFRRYAPDLESTDPEYFRFVHGQYSYGTDHLTDEFCRAAAYMRGRPKARETSRMMREHGERLDGTVGAGIEEARRRIRDGVLTAPTLYVFGRDDMTVPLATAIGAFEMMSQENPNVRLELLNRCGHLPYRERPEEFSRIVAGFVDRWR